jgi:hypothetical protein
MNIDYPTQVFDSEHNFRLPFIAAISTFMYTAFAMGIVGAILAGKVIDGLSVVKQRSRS